MINSFGTIVYTKFFGNFVGKDDAGNRYYMTSDNQKKWVLYSTKNDASNVNSAWHLWLTNDRVKAPVEKNKIFNWQKKHMSNKTGSLEAYRPEGDINKKVNLENNKNKLYNSWEPPK